MEIMKETLKLSHRALRSLAQCFSTQEPSISHFIGIGFYSCCPVHCWIWLAFLPPCSFNPNHLGNQPVARKGINCCLLEINWDVCTFFILLFRWGAGTVTMPVLRLRVLTVCSVAWTHKLSGTKKISTRGSSKGELILVLPGLTPFMAYTEVLRS